jgi:hypothetical protein
MIFFLIKSLILCLVINVPGVLLAAVVLGLFLLRRTPLPRAIAYACFVLAGAVVARFQYALIVIEDPDTVGFYQFATIVLVSTVCLTALIVARRLLKVEWLLSFLFLLSLLLAILQFGGLRYDLLNWYARLYALACLAVPIFVLIRDWNVGRCRP